MANRLFSTLVPTIAASAPGCPTPTITDYVRKAAIEACERTLFWRYRTDNIALTPLQSTYNYSDALNPGGGSGEVVTVTLDPTYSNPAMILSNGNLSAQWSLSGSFGCSYATVPRSAGKYYFEIINTTPGGYGGAIYDNWSFNAGLSVDRNITNDKTAGSTPNSWAFSNANNTGVTTNTSTIAAGVVTIVTGVSQIPQDGYLGVAVDLDSGKIWFNANGTWINSGNPAAGTNPTYTFTPTKTLYPALGQGSYNPGGKSTANFGATAFLGTKPSGFNAWNTSGGGGGGGGIPNAIVHAVFGATFVEGQVLEALTLEEAIRRFPKWDAADQASQPQVICQLNTMQYIVLPKPESGSAYTLALTLALKPTKTATGMDEDVFNELEDVIMHNTLQRLLMLPNQNWSDREAAGYHARQYLFKLSERRARANLGNARGKMAVRIPSFS